MLRYFCNLNISVMLTFFKLFSACNVTIKKNMSYYEKLLLVVKSWRKFFTRCNRIDGVC